MKIEEKLKNKNICPICKNVTSNKIYCSKVCYFKDDHCKHRKNGKGGIRKGANLPGSYVVYKTINLLNNEYYIGVHKITDLEKDKYLGSGLRILRSIKKYGRKNFKRMTLYTFNEEHLAYEKEYELIDLKDPLCLNLMIGGLGGANFLGRKHTEETKKKLSEIGKKINTKMNPISKEKILQFNTGRIFSQESKNKISNSLKEYHKRRLLLDDT